MGLSERESIDTLISDLSLYVEQLKIARATVNKERQKHYAAVIETIAFELNYRIQEVEK